MSIKPIDYQVMMPKTQEVSHIKHNEQRAALVNQDNLAKQVQQQAVLHHQSVDETNKKTGMNKDMDPRKEGQNKYQPSEQKEKKKSPKPKESQMADEERKIGKGLDIRI